MIDILVTLSEEDKKKFFKNVKCPFDGEGIKTWAIGSRNGKAFIELEIYDHPTLALDTAHRIGTDFFDKAWCFNRIEADPTQHSKWAFYITMGEI